jgi:NADH dehydrogenase FAD-containing subunit
MKVVIVGSGAAGIGLAEELKRQAPDTTIALVNNTEWTAPTFPVRIKVHGFR